MCLRFERYNRRVYNHSVPFADMARCLLISLPLAQRQPIFIGERADARFAGKSG